ncbi:MAG: class I SAM-dependent methyltransferase [Solirubrobacteraceae bacterium]|nr:class I SAM-dependent methyltransferase [Solirubrobacteraceae bacterium]
MTQQLAPGLSGDSAVLAADDALDAVALGQLAALPGPFLPWTDYSMRPSAIVAVLTDVLLAGRQRVVELGSGNSTVYLARLARQHGLTVQITTVDHDAQWADATGAALAREQLSAFVDVVHAPLKDGWYDRAALPTQSEVDLLVIDGPPAFQPGMGLAREPALDHFAPLLTRGATVVLDDAHRPGEQQVLAAWSERHDRHFRLERGGYGVSSPWTSS